LASIKFAGRRINLPRSRLARFGLGVLFILGGIFAFLPVLGIWMLPLGMMIIATDNAKVRRFNRRAFVSGMERWRKFRGKPRRPKPRASVTPDPAASD